MSQVEALAETIAALELKSEHRAFVAYCEGLAAALDEYPERATLWREYRPALELLLVFGEASEDDGQAAILELLSTPVGDSTKAGSGNARGRGRSGRKNAGPAADAVARAGSERRAGTSP